MRNLHIGIDPGKKGAIAVIGDCGSVQHTMPIPMIPAAKIPKGRKRRPNEREQYDIAAIRDYLKGTADRCLLVTVERSQPMSMIPFGNRPGADAFKPGSLAQYERGVQRGFEWLLTALEIPFQLISPWTWQKAIHAGTPTDKLLNTKERSIVAAEKLFPGVDLRRTPRCRVSDDGIAEAILLAEYGRRVFMAGVSNETSLLRRDGSR